MKHGCPRPMQALDRCVHARTLKQALVALTIGLSAACAPSSVGTTRTGSGSGQPPPPTSGDRILYVDANTGKDANDGRSAKTAFQTLQRAVRDAKPGWTVKVMSGTYTTDGTTEPLLIDVSGTADAPITFTADAG